MQSGISWTTYLSGLAWSLYKHLAMWWTLSSFSQWTGPLEDFTKMERIYFFSLSVRKQRQVRVGRKNTAETKKRTGKPNKLKVNTNHQSRCIMVSATVLDNALMSEVASWSWSQYSLSSIYCDRFNFAFCGKCAKIIPSWRHCHKDQACGRNAQINSCTIIFEIERQLLHPKRPSVFNTSGIVNILLKGVVYYICYS